MHPWPALNMRAPVVVLKLFQRLHARAQALNQTKRGVKHLVWLGGLHYSYYTEPYKSDPNLMGFTNEAIGPMISVFMRMMFQV